MTNGVLIPLVPSTGTDSLGYASIVDVLTDGLVPPFPAPIASRPLSGRPMDGAVERGNRSRRVIEVVGDPVE
ncbi:hypothetical protein ABID08_001413 [Rhizobium binae]|uniref:Uncharacterized protein n=1 Tax=Rhizobium binae TaxID=1138190 RepID=A0ABV2MC77_9HYPH